MSTLQWPLVSIGMPVRNGAEYLRDTLEAVLNQSYGNFELIITDNASADATWEICEEYAARDGRVRCIHLSEKISFSENFNRSLQEARGEHFVWIAHDDLWDYEYLHTMVCLLHEKPTAVLAFSRFDNIDGRNAIYRTFSRDWSRLFSGPKILQLCRFILADADVTGKNNHIYGLMRTSVLRERGGIQNVPLYAGPDPVTLFHLLTLGDFAVSPGTLFHYRYGHRGDPAGAGELPRIAAATRRLRRHFDGLSRFLSGNHIMHACLRKYTRSSSLSLSGKTLIHVVITYAEYLNIVRGCLRVLKYDLSPPRHWQRMGSR